jgi:hypothetical protein
VHLKIPAILFLFLKNRLRVSRSKTVLFPLTVANVQNSIMGNDSKAREKLSKTPAEKGGDDQVMKCQVPETMLTARSPSLKM